jgi:hypothetical protein
MVAEIAFVFVVVALALPGLIRAFELAIHVRRLGQSHVSDREAWRAPPR